MLILTSFQARTNQLSPKHPKYFESLVVLNALKQGRCANLPKFCNFPQI